METFFSLWQQEHHHLVSSPTSSPLHGPVIPKCASLAGKNSNSNGTTANTGNYNSHRLEGGSESQQFRDNISPSYDVTVNARNKQHSWKNSHFGTCTTTTRSPRAATPGIGDDNLGSIAVASGPLALGDVDTKAVDEILSSQLADMSFADRNAINEEVHGVRNMAAEETPAMLEKSLLMFRMLLDRVEEKTAYNEAVYVYQSRWIMHDPTLKLRCLRAERFDITKAVNRYVKYLDLLLEYYGADALIRPIRMSDLGSEEMELLRSGEYQILPFRDRAGRPVITCLGDVGLKYPMRVRMKFLIYFWTVASEDLESQQRGSVNIFWPEKHNYPDKREAEEAKRVFAAVPIRMTALHQCMPDTPTFQLTKAVIILSLDVEARTRIKFHSNDEIETQYALLSYGIPVDLIPKTGTGKVKTKNLQQWIRIRKVIEETKEDSPIECPRKHDVVFRSGKSYLSHPGNQTFRGLVEAKFDEHNTALTNDAKVAVSWRIVEDVENRGGRFLVWDNRGWWKVTTDRVLIRSKVAVSLKEQKKRVQALINMQSNSSSTYQFEGQDCRKRRRVDDGSEPSKCFCIDS